MQQLTDRQQKILYHIVNDYIVSAIPIGSEMITQRYNLGVSPATVRNEMGELTNCGYLAKQHVSSGRVPTPRAYRFFVDRFAGEKDTDVSVRTKQALHTLRRIENMEKNDYRFTMRTIADTLSSLAHAFTIGYFPDEDMVWRDGIEYFLEEPEFSTHQALHDATLFAERVHNIFFSELKDYFTRIQNLQVFIGDENPFQEIENCENYSMMIAPLIIGKQKRLTLFTLVGPLRMPYDRDISLLEYFMHFQEQQ